MKNFDADIAALCKAVRENDETEALNRSVGLLADFMNTQERIAASLDAIHTELVHLPTKYVFS